MSKLKWTLLILVAAVSFLMVFAVDYEGREEERRKAAGKAAAEAAVLEDPRLKALDLSPELPMENCGVWISVYSGEVVGEKEMAYSFDGPIVAEATDNSGLGTGWGVEGTLRLRKTGREWVTTDIDYEFVRE